MPHPFGELLTQFRTRKHGLSQARLAQLVGYDAALIAKMGKGQRELTGPSGRERVVRIIGALKEEEVLSTLDEANSLLAAANLPPLYDGLPVESALMRQLEQRDGVRGPERSARRHTNLPAPLTSFIGRRAELVELAAKMQSGRLLTLTGMGGCGKTRLAIELAGQLLPQFEDGAWWVELASLRDGTLTPDAVAKALEVQESRGEPLRDTLMRKLRDQHMLLVLDNCEHVLSECAPFVEAMLLACRGLKVLTTSREALGLTGEMLWPVQPLSLPLRDVSSPVQLLEQSESVRLFCDRATAVNPAFALTADNASTVSQICHRLDGIPLALELAAARTRLVPVEQIALWLDDGLNLPAASNRNTFVRHHTMRSAIDWSYGHLNEAERIWFGQLAVFVGGWDVDAARRLADSDAQTTFDLLSRLVDKSLVLTDHKHGRQRFRMLETIRDYALDALRAQSPHAEPIARQHHLAHYLTLAETPWPTSADEKAAWLDRLEADHDNFRAALDWALSQQEGNAALRLVWALSPFWERQRHFREARDAVARALAVSGPSDRTMARARVLSLTSQAWYNDHYRESKPMLQEALAISEELGDRAFAAHALFTLGCNAYHCGDFADELDYFLRSLAVWQELGDKAGICRQLGFVGGGYYDIGDIERARLTLEEAVRLADEIHAQADKAQSLLWLGNVVLALGDCAKAADLLREGLLLNRSIGMPYSLVFAIEPFISLATAQSQNMRAARLLGARDAVIERDGLGKTGWGWPNTERHLEIARQQLGQEAFAAARTEGRAMTQDQALEYALAES